MWIDESGDGVTTCLDCGRKGHIEGGVYGFGSGMISCDVHGVDGFDASRPRAATPGVFVSEFIIAACPEWPRDLFPVQDGILWVRYSRFEKIDTPVAWLIRDRNDRYLTRDAFEWRKSHPSDPLRLPGDIHARAPDSRRIVAELFSTYPRSRRAPAEFLFTLEEALRVCNVKL